MRSYFCVVPMLISLAFLRNWQKKMQLPISADIYHGDCLTLLKDVEPDSVDLVYMDPPFLTQKTQRLKTRDRCTEFSFDDSWTSPEEYAEFMLARLRAIYRALAPTASLFFHCDRNATHIARRLLDEVFGSNSFRSEIIWRYRRWSNLRRGLLPAHQTIYYYSKSDEFTFNVIWEEYSPSTNVDQILQQRTRDAHGKSVYKRDRSGQVVSNGAKRGVPLNDVWDIPYLNPKARERTGYPTQKPLLLLEHIIEIATREGDVVLDPFCGSGTTLLAAELLGRKAIGIDISADAIELTRKRLQNPTRSESALLLHGRESYRKADESALSLLQGLEYVPVQRNKGIDAILKQDYEGTPIPVRVQRDWETILEAALKLSKASENKNARVMFLIATASGGCFPFADDMPHGVVVVNAPSLGIDEYLSTIRETASPQPGAAGCGSPPGGTHRRRFL